MAFCACRMAFSNAVDPRGVFAILSIAFLNGSLSYPPNIPNTQVGVYGDWFNDGNPTWDDGDGEDLYLKEVTHWMPLPEPPRLKEL